MAMHQSYQGSIPAPYSAAPEIEKAVDNDSRREPDKYLNTAQLWQAYADETAGFLKTRPYVATHFRKIARNDQRIQGSGKSLWMQDLFHTINELDKLSA